MGKSFNIQNVLNSYKFLLVILNIHSISSIIKTYLSKYILFKTIGNLKIFLESSYKTDVKPLLKCSTCNSHKILAYDLIILLMFSSISMISIIIHNILSKGIILRLNGLYP